MATVKLAAAAELARSSSFMPRGRYAHFVDSTRVPLARQKNVTIQKLKQFDTSLSADICLTNGRIDAQRPRLPGDRCAAPP